MDFSSLYDKNNSSNGIMHRMLVLVMLLLSGALRTISVVECFSSTPSSTCKCPGPAPSKYVQSRSQSNNMNTCPTTTNGNHHVSKDRQRSRLEARLTDNLSTFFDEEEVITMTPFESTFPFVSRIIGGPSEVSKLMAFLRQEMTDIKQIIFFALVGYSIPLFGQVVRKRFMKIDVEHYRQTVTHHVMNHISQGFKLGALTTLIESISEMILGLDTEIAVLVTNTISSILFSIWGMYRVKFIKNALLKYYCKSLKLKPRIIRLYERTSDFFLYIITAVISLDTLGFKYQSAIRGLSVFGGVGTIVLSLASKDMSTQLLSGMSIQVNQQFVEGDEIQLEGGVLGIVESVGPLHTYIRGHDEIIVKISNADLEKMRVGNLSIGTISQVKQQLRFDFSSIDNISELVDEIRSEIKDACDELIVDGSRPFRVHWTNFGEEWLEVSVDCRMNIAPLTDRYYDARQNILEAIARAAKRCNAKFAENLK